MPLQWCCLYIAWLILVRVILFELHDACSYEETIVLNVSFLMLQNKDRLVNENFTLLKRIGVFKICCVVSG